MQRAQSLASGFFGRFRRVAIFALMALMAPPAHADTQIFTLFDFQFEDGTIMPELRIGYETQGTLSPLRDNAIVLLHDALTDHHAFDDWIGPGKLFDTGKYFVIAPDAIGGGESTAPSDGKGQDFPRYTIRDVMAADYALVARGLGLTQLRAIVGRSMGGSVALEWGIHHPEMPRGLVLLAPSARSDANYQTIVDLLTSAVAFDPDWAGGRYERNPVEGLRHAGMIYYPWSVSATYLNALPAAALAQESEAAAKQFAGWDANGLMLRYGAARGHDAAAGVGGDLDAALGRVTMPVLLMPSASDRLVDPSGAQLLKAKLPQAIEMSIDGNRGHSAVAAPPASVEGAFIARTIRTFLK